MGIGIGAIAECEEMGVLRRGAGDSTLASGLAVELAVGIARLTARWLSTSHAVWCPKDIASTAARLAVGPAAGSPISSRIDSQAALAVGLAYGSSMSTVRRGRAMRSLACCWPSGVTCRSDRR